jgi:YihY family inner membrane protein
MSAIGAAYRSNAGDKRPIALPAAADAPGTWAELVSRTRRVVGGDADRLMADRPSTIRGGLRRVAAHASRSDAAFTAAAVAYYAQVSLVPLGVLGFVVVATVAGDRLALTAVEAVGDSLSPTGERLLRDAVTGGAGRAEASVGGLAVFVWGTLRLFRALETAFASVYPTEKSTVRGWRDAAVAATGVPVALATVAVGGVAFRYVGIEIPSAARAVVLAAVLAVVLLPAYRVLPTVSIPLREAVPGTALAAGGLVVLRQGFAVYLAVAGGATLYGALGAVVVVVTWLYLASLLLVAGAVVNVVLAGRDRA